ncbi:Ig-like domain-containing protein [Duganella sp. BuS-21]|uniref:Ig-like domain-containing protein n=1 Tax=Duganella sp. BuS-21 TaxID=2943848 RepID=UPI0035A661EA
MAVVTVPGPRVITLGNALAAQTGAGGQWATAWSLTGVTVNLAEAAQAVTLKLSSFYAGDDGSTYAEGARVRLFDGAGNLVGETYLTANSVGGEQLVQLNSAQAFRSVEISAGARKADGSFSFGAYHNSNGSFGSEIYTAGTRHGSDFLLDAISFTLARPAVAADSDVLDEDAPLTNFANVLVNDTDANGAALSAVLETAPAHGTLTFNADGSFSYQVEANYNGADCFTYRASNGKDYSVAATVNLTINAVNDAPVANNDSASTNEDTVVTGNVLNGSGGGLDIDGDTLALLTTGAFTTTLGAIVTLNANGNYSYDPTGSSALQSMAEGATSVDGFDYTVSDGHGGTSTAHLAVTVQGREEAGGAVLLPSVEPGSELNYFMRYTTASGASAWVEIDALTLGMSSEITAGKAGSQLGKATADDVVLNLGGSKAVGELTSRLLTGTTVHSVEVKAYLGDGKGKLLVQEYKFTDALVTSAQSAIDVEGGADNTLAFTYRTMDQALTPYGKDERPVTPQKFSWDFVQGNAKIDGNAQVDPGADAVVGGAASDGHPALDYYIHIDGVDGWVELSSFMLGYTAEVSSTKGGSAAAKPVASEVALELGLSRVLNTLLKNEFTGNTATIQVEAYLPGDQGSTGKLIDEYIFTPQLSVPENTDLRYYLRYTDGGTSKWVQIDGFSFGVDAEVGITKGAGVIVANPVQQAFTIQLGTGKALADFTLNLLNGSDIGTIEIEAHVHGVDADLVVQEYKLTKAYVTAVETAANLEGATSNTLSLAYSTVDHAVSTIGNDGKLTKAISAGYDFVKESTNLPSQALVDPGLDATPNQLAPQVSTDAPLEYYIHINGVAGWVALSSFSLD